MTTTVESSVRDRDALRAILNEWDPIGLRGIVAVVPDLAFPADEYDCAHESVLRVLVAGGDAEAVRRALQVELDEHFEIGGEAPIEVAQDITNWWARRD